MEPAIAVAAVLSYRLLTFWLPILPGWLCFHLARPPQLHLTSSGPDRTTGEFEDVSSVEVCSFDPCGTMAVVPERGTSGIVGDGDVVAVRRIDRDRL